VLTHDVYPDVLLPTKLLRYDDVLYKLLQRLTRRMLSSVQGIVALGRDMAELLQSYVGSRSVPIRIIPNWAEPDRIKPRPREENRQLKELSLQEKFVVLHAGTMGRTHGIEDVLEVARRGRSQKDIHFLFAGVGVKRQLVERALREPGANGNLSLLPFVDARDQNELLNACDVAVIAMVGGMCGISVPSRMYNTMAAGKPIVAITDARSELARVIIEEQIGWVVEPGHIDAVIDVLNDARTRPDRLAEIGRRARQVAETKYTAQAAISAFDSLLREIDIQ
jgi:glycosyltransferase involved in cell wall biosynthesis